jgi:hypothetical protein
VQVYLTLRAAAQATEAWAQLYPELSAEIEKQTLAALAQGASGFPVDTLRSAALLGYARLLEGQIEQAVAWALRPEIPTGWRDDDLTSTVAGGLLRMGLAAAHVQPDDVLGEALAAAPAIIHEQGAPSDMTARTLPPHRLRDGAIRAYERLLNRAVEGRKQESYAVAGSYANVIRAIRTI